MKRMLLSLTACIALCACAPSADAAPSTSKVHALESAPTRPFTIAIDPSAAQPRNDATQPQPYFDGGGWLVQDAVLPLRYPIQLETGAVITGWELDLWREDEGPNTSGVLERLHRVALDDPGNSTELHDRVTNPLQHTSPAPLSISELEIEVDTTGPISLAVRGNGIIGDRALALYVSGYYP